MLGGRIGWIGSGRGRGGIGSVSLGLLGSVLGSLGGFLLGVLERCEGFRSGRFGLGGILRFFEFRSRLGSFLGRIGEGFTGGFLRSVQLIPQILCFLGDGFLHFGKL